VQKENGGRVVEPKSNFAEIDLRLVTSLPAKVAQPAAKDQRISPRFALQTISITNLRTLLKKMLEVPSRTKLPYVRKSFIGREYHILRYFLAYAKGSGRVPDQWRHSALQSYFALKKEVGRVRASRRRFKALADPNKIIWVRPEDITYKLKYDLDIYFGDILSGDWDVRRLVELESSEKHRSVYQRYVLGFSWEDTELFRRIYTARLESGERIRGVESVGDLANEYGRKVDGLFSSMKQEGFVIERDASGRPKTLPHVHIGRNGDIIFGNNGNHRLAIARILKVESVPCWVRSRHLLWQRVREQFAVEAAKNPFAPSVSDAHPDLADLLGTEVTPPRLIKPEIV
jgi:hypothetical protein